MMQPLMKRGAQRFFGAAGVSSRRLASTAIRASSPKSPLTVHRPAFRPARINAIQTRNIISGQVREAIDKAVSSAPVVLFMKGTPDLPQCGFSRATVQILGIQGVDPSKFVAFNVLEDQSLREGIKTYSDWPTIPQLYVNKQFIGGCDILMSMHQDGSLGKLLESEGVTVPPEPEKPAA